MQKSISGFRNLGIYYTDPGVSLSSAHLLTLDHEFGLDIPRILEVFQWNENGSIMTLSIVGWISAQVMIKCVAQLWLGNDQTY